MARDSFLRCRVSDQVKKLLQTIAEQRQTTESALVRQVIEVMVQNGDERQNLGRSSLERDCSGRPGLPATIRSNASADVRHRPQWVNKATFTDASPVFELNVWNREINQAPPGQFHPVTVPE